MQKPYFDTPMDFIARGVELCWKNATALIAEAKLLQEHRFYARALSLSILALEELGKLMTLDGLAFSVVNNEISNDRKKLFNECLRSHSTKLRILDGYPLFLSYIATLDPGYKTDEKFGLTMAIVVERYRKDRMELAKWLGEDCDLKKLNELKKKGFYVGRENGSLVSPLDVDQALVKGICRLACDMVDGIDFVLKHNLERYKDFVSSVRNKLTKEQLAEVRRLGQEVADKIFGSD